MPLKWRGESPVGLHWFPRTSFAGSTICGSTIWIGKGMGTVLFRAVVKRARELQASRLEEAAERHSVGFYEKMGGRYLRDSEPSVWGPDQPRDGIEPAVRTSCRIRLWQAGHIICAFHKYGKLMLGRVI